MGMPMRHTTSRILYAYWNEVRGARAAPRRFEIDPARLAAILPDIFILERTSADTYPFRLAGTRLCAQFGAEFRGLDFLSFWPDADRAALRQRLSVITAQGGAVVFTMEARSSAGKVVTFEAIVLPLIHVRQSVDRFLGAVSALAAPAWLGTEPLTTWTLLKHANLWTRQAPRLGASGADVGAIAAPLMAAPERPTLRVLEGGLSREDTKYK